MELTALTTQTADDIAVFMVEAYDNSIQCSPVVQVLTTEQVQKLMDDDTLTCWLVIDEDGTWQGFLCVESDTGRIPWFNARRDQFGACIVCLCEHYAPIPQALYGYVTNTYLRDIYLAQTPVGCVISQDGTNPAIIRMEPA